MSQLGNGPSLQPATQKNNKGSVFLRAAHLKNMVHPLSSAPVHEVSKLPATVLPASLPKVNPNARLPGVQLSRLGNARVIVYPDGRVSAKRLKLGQYRKDFRPRYKERKSRKNSANHAGIHAYMRLTPSNKAAMGQSVAAGDFTPALFLFARQRSQ